MNKIIHEIQLLFLGTSKIRKVLSTLFFCYPFISFLIWGHFELDYIILGVMALSTSFNMLLNYKLLNSFSLFAALQDKLKPIGEKKQFIIYKIESVWNVNKSLSIILFLLFSVSLLMIQKNITEIMIVYSITWMLYAINELYDSLLFRIIRSYREYDEE